MKRKDLAKWADMISDDLIVAGILLILSAIVAALICVALKGFDLVEPNFDMIWPFGALGLALAMAGFMFMVIHEVLKS